MRRLELRGFRIEVYEQTDAASEATAGYLIQTINAASSSGRDAVLGLATGSSPIPVYAELVRRFRQGELSFRGTTTFNLDEYYPVSALDPRSYRHYMHHHLFAHVDLAANRAHVPDGTVPEVQASAHALDYERWIDAAGGLDLQLLGIGRNGHIGFNEPCERPLAEALALPTRLCALHPITIEDATRDCGGHADAVPRRAFTLGVAAILRARRIVMLAVGQAKATVVAEAITGPMTSQLPASLLQQVAQKVTWILDEPAAVQLPGA